MCGLPDSQAAECRFQSVRSIRGMRITVYTPQTLNINKSDIPKLTDAARKRHRMESSKKVPLRYIIDEARRAGLIQLGRNYCIDLETDHRGNGASKGKQSKKNKR